MDPIEKSYWQWWQKKPELHDQFRINDMDLRRGLPGRWHVEKTSRGVGANSVTYWETIGEAMEFIRSEVRRRQGVYTEME